MKKEQSCPGVLTVTDMESRLDSGKDTEMLHGTERFPEGAALVPRCEIVHTQHKHATTLHASIMLHTQHNPDGRTASRSGSGL